MEFMYCIPDLEVFIDKTIKKCLLEYDLDANDTEAVLDDMEKAWPKSPPRPPDKQALKDCNDNTENGRVNRQLSGANQSQESAGINVTLDKTLLKGGDTVLPHTASESAERILSDDGFHSETVANEKCRSASVGGECSRSDTSSPDVGNWKPQTQTHSKPKSRLQQRYFEGSKTSSGDYEQTRNSSDNKVGASSESNQSTHSNLELLASAANIHTETNRRTEKYRSEILHLQEESDRHLKDASVKTFQKESSDRPEFAKDMPVLTRLMTYPLTSTLRNSAHFINHAAGGAIGQHSNGRRTTCLDPFMKVRPDTRAHEGLPFTTARLEEDKNKSLPSTEKAKRLFQYYQIGYHALIPRETVVVRRQLSSTSDDRDGDARKRHTPTLITNPGSSWKTLVEETPSYNHLATRHRCQQQNKNLHNNFISDSSSKPVHHYHESRIASIITEELQKDNSSHHNTLSRKTIPSIDRVIPEAAKYSVPAELNRVKSLAPEYCNRVASGEVQHHPLQIVRDQTQADTSHHGDNTCDDSVVRTHSRMPQLLPAHTATLNHNLDNDIVAFKLSHLPSFSSNITPGKAATATNNKGCTDVEDQPQDLSTKPRRNVEKVAEHDLYSYSSSNPNSPVKDIRRSGYFSSPSSPFLASLSTCQTESLSLAKSSSPSNSSDKECDYNSGNSTRSNPLKTSGNWDKKGQVHGLHIYPSGDSKALVEKRRMETVKRWLGAQDSVTSKKRKIEI